MKLYVLAALVTTLACQAQEARPTDKLVGRWRPLETASDGLGTALEFHPDGRVDSSEGAVVEATYRIENGQLFLPPPTTDGPEAPLKVEWAGNDKLRLSDPKSTPKSGAASDTLTRRGTMSDPKNPIVGEWAGMRDMGSRKLESLWIFYPTGKTLLILPFTIQHGKYSISADGATLRMEIPGKPPKEDKFTIDGGVLTMGDGLKYVKY